MNMTFLTGKEIAEILKISKALAYRLISRGEIPSIRFGRTVRVKQADLEKFIAENTAVDRLALSTNALKSEVTTDVPQ
jgi:excisionase family DNA binding protein